MAELGVEIGGILLIGAFLWLSIGGVKAHIDENMRLLSEELAQAVLNVAQSTASANIEQPNPMQMMVMQLIQSRMQQERGPDGTFKALSVEKGNK